MDLCIIVTIFLTTVTPYVGQNSHKHQSSLPSGLQAFELQVIKPKLSKCRVISSHECTVVTEWEMFACVMKCGGVRVHTGDLFILANLAEPSCDLNRIPCST